MKVSTVSEMRALDRTAIEEFGITEELLMENAGQAVCFVLLTEYGIAGRRFLVFCGLGNNGGDGLVVARKIHSTGGSVKVFILGDPSKFKGAARLNFDIVSRMPIEVQQLESSATGSMKGMLADIGDCDGIVDAILGTGITRDVEGLYRDVVQAINGSGKQVFSIDIPSGVHGDTGKVMGAAVRADHTVIFGLPKLGNLLLPGYDLGGKLHVSHISFPPSMIESAALKAEINCPVPLPIAREDAPERDSGQALFIAGAAGYHGAPYLAALSFLRAGGGRAYLAAPRSITSFIAKKAGTIVLMPQEETGVGTIALENRGALLELAGQVDIVVLGPGLSLQPETQQLTRELARQIKKPLLIDGDGITAVCRDLQIIRDREAETVITPDLGEMARIAKRDVSDVETHKVSILQRTCEALGSTIVLRCARSLIGYPDGHVFFNMSGPPGVAMAESGDVQTGTIAAMFGLGIPLGAAVRGGVFIHGLSGSLAVDDRAGAVHPPDRWYPDECSIMAQDIVDTLPAAVEAVREGLDEQLIDHCAGIHVV
jgi:NAD(P)H-hydrate epimerase